MRAAALIPAFNEARTIAAVVEGVRGVVAHVIVVDDGSSDGTAERARAAGAEVIVHDANRGKGHAVRTGLRRVFRDAVDAGLVLVRLLVGDADQLGHLLLGQAQHDAALTDAQADIVVDVERPTPTAAVPPGRSCSLAGSPKTSLAASGRARCGARRGWPLNSIWLKYS